MTLETFDAVGLLERDRELELLSTALAAAAAGSGRLVVIEGEAGIGKTELLVAAAQLASTSLGLDVHRARGGELERGMTLGVVRQLFEARAARADESVQGELFSGAARLARSLLGLDPQGAGPTDEPSIVHALYWLCANFAERSPICLMVDDAQWSDAPSLRFLLYLARRLEELPVALFVGVRTGDPDAPTDLLESLASQPGAERVVPELLSESATTTLVMSALGRASDPAFAHAIQDATGGNPFLTRELLAGLVADGIEPSAEAAQQIGDLRPQAVASSILLRLGRLPTQALALARAVAVLGTEASLAEAGAVSELDPDVAAGAADALTAAQFLKPTRPLEFLHPVLRSVLYQDIPAAERARAHARAARVLRDAGRPGADVVAHLLATEPSGDQHVVAGLRAALAGETDPRRGAALMARALAEPPAADTRVDILLELGEAETRAYEPDAIQHLTEARAASGDHAVFMRATRALARAWTLHEDPARACEWARNELGALGDEGLDPEVREMRLSLLALEAIRGPVEHARALALREEARSGHACRALPACGARVQGDHLG